MDKSYSDVVGDFEAELIYIRDKGTEISFRLGDIDNELTMIHQDTPKEFVHSAVGCFAGRSSRTVREYADVARFYPNEIRQEYGALSFWHFRFAYNKTNWKEILDYALLPEGLSRPATVDAILANFANPMTADELQRFLEKLRENYDRIKDKLTDEQRGQCEHLISEITDVLTPTAIEQGIIESPLWLVAGEA